jgi:excisionase family DNA binding protein
MTKWVLVSEACQAFGKSDRTIRRWIEEGKLKSRKAGRNVEVLLEVADIESAHGGQSTAEVEIARLKAEVDGKDQVIKTLSSQVEELSASRERQDTLMLQLTRQIEQSQRLLEHHQEPFYRRWFRKKREIEGQ